MHPMFCAMKQNETCQIQLIKTNVNYNSENCKQPIAFASFGIVTRNKIFEKFPRAICCSFWILFYKCQTRKESIIILLLKSAVIYSSYSILSNIIDEMKICEINKQFHSWVTSLILSNLFFAKLTLVNSNHLLYI